MSRKYGYLCSAIGVLMLMVGCDTADLGGYRHPPVPPDAPAVDGGVAASVDPTLVAAAEKAAADDLAKVMQGQIRDICYDQPLGAVRRCSTVCCLPGQPCDPWTPWWCGNDPGQHEVKFVTLSGQCFIANAAIWLHELGQPAAAIGRLSSMTGPHDYWIAGIETGANTFAMFVEKACWSMPPDAIPIASNMRLSIWDNNWFIKPLNSMAVVRWPM